jgi:hypothetical protein
VHPSLSSGRLNGQKHGVAESIHIARGEPAQVVNTTVTQIFAFPRCVALLSMSSGLVGSTKQERWDTKNEL